MYINIENKSRTFFSKIYIITQQCVALLVFVMELRVNSPLVKIEFYNYYFCCPCPLILLEKLLFAFV